MGPRGGVQGATPRALEAGEQGAGLGSASTPVGRMASLPAVPAWFQVGVRLNLPEEAWSGLGGEEVQVACVWELPLPSDPTPQVPLFLFTGHPGVQ